MRRFLTAALATALLATGATARPTPQQKLDKILAGRVAGPPEQCISLANNNRSQIIAGVGIVYGSGNRLWLNRPTSGADSLREDDILLTRVTTGQLCNVDIVRLVDRVGRFERGFVNLGDFVPYTRAGKN
jgi:hypothetical protein